MDIAALKDKLNAPHVELSQLAAGYPVIDVNNTFASARIALHGAHVMSFQPHGQAPLLWCSKAAIFKESKPIRGGIPICWPWFGNHADIGKPAHGFARNQFWQLHSVEENAKHETEIVLALTDNEISRKLWPHVFKLIVTIVVGPVLTVRLETINTDDVELSITAALHSYIKIGDIENIEVLGFEQSHYQDKLMDDILFLQSGSVRFNSELDRIYLDTTADVIIKDDDNSREVRVAKAGSYSTVLWNPWIEKSATMNDFEENGYRNMVCVEAANTAERAVVIKPGETHTLETVISIA